MNKSEIEFSAEQREKLVEILDKFQYDWNDYIGNNKYFLIDDHIELANHLISNGVTVRESGRWIKTEVGSNCSVCGLNVTSWSGDYDGYERERGICLMHYCPNCGARMDGDWNDC